MNDRLRQPEQWDSAVTLSFAEDFIAALTGSENSAVTFQTFDDTGAKRRELARILHGTLSQHAGALQKLNERGAGVFVTVNETDGRGRQASNIVGLRALFVDDDCGALPSNLHAEENIRVSSARGEHVYWLLRPGEALAQFRTAQRALIDAYSTDRSVHDLPRVMRLPGFLHRKGAPLLVSCDVRGTRRYSIREVLSGLPPKGRSSGVALGDASGEDAALFRARRYLHHIPGAIQGQGGDNHTFKTACCLVRGFALSDSQAIGLLREWNASCVPPWEENDLVAKIAHARRYGHGDFGALLNQPMPPQEGCAVANVTGASNDNQDVVDVGEVNRNVHQASQTGALRNAGGGRDKYRFIKVSEALKDPVVGAGMVVPYGYKLSTRPGRGVVLDGACRRKAKRQGDDEVPEDHPIAGFPIIIKSRLVDVADGSVQFEVACLIGKDWKTHVIDRSRALNARQVTELADHDFPVASTNARELVHYLATFDDTNRWAIPTRARATQMGWHRSGGADVFVLGNECYVPNDKVPPVKFVGDSSGDTHLARCIRSEGTYDGWLGAMQLARKYPRVELGVYAALATPLLKIVGAPSFAVDWCAESSTGKTTTMKMAASVWSVPDERSHHSLIHSWNTTQVGLERLAAALSGLPLFMDETKQAPSGPQGRSIVPGCIYQITNGQGKARGAVEGRRQTLYWNTLLLTTGEKAAVDHSKDAGPAARLLTLWGPPFGGQTDDVLKIEAILASHYGFAGPLFVRWLVQHRVEHGDSWRDQYHRLRAHFLRAFEDRIDTGVAARLAKYAALLELTAVLAHEALRFPWVYDSCIDKIVDAIAQGAGRFDRPTEALVYAYNRAVAAKSCFYHCHDRSRPPPEFYGHWKVRESKADGEAHDDYDFIGFLPPYLEHVLRAGQFDVEPTIKLWHERGWLTTTKGKRGLRVYINGDLPYVYAVKKSAIDEAIGG